METNYEHTNELIKKIRKYRKAKPDNIILD